MLEYITSLGTYCYVGYIKHITVYKTDQFEDPFMT